jgi:hypothetical protein
MNYQILILFNRKMLNKIIILIVLIEVTATIDNKLKLLSYMY